MNCVFPGNFSALCQNNHESPYLRNLGLQSQLAGNREDYGKSKLAESCSSKELFNFGLHFVRVVPYQKMNDICLREGLAAE